MHQCGDFVHFTPLREEPSIIDRMIRAALKDDLTRFQADTLRLIHDYMVVKNFDIRLDTFDNFLVVLAQLGIPKPELNVRVVEGKYRGSRPRLPDPRKDPLGFKKQKQKRAIKRVESFREILTQHQLGQDEFMARLGYASRRDPIEQKLTQIHTKVHEITDHFDQSFADFLRKMGISQDDPKAAEVKQTFLKLIVNNTRSA